jgi:hypothetical protein
MTRMLAAIALTNALLTAPALAQTRKTEFGADVAIKWTKVSGASEGFFDIQTPVDLRIAFHLGNSLALEPRLTARFLSGGGGNVYAIDPGLNVLVGLPGSTYNKGSYVTAGADLAVTGGTDMTGESYVTFNLGMGSRAPVGSGAARGELYLAFTPRQGTAAPSSILTIGARIGLSFFN